MAHEGSYLWRLRQKVGSGLVLMPGAQVLVLDADGRGLFSHRTDTGRWEIPAGACEEGSGFASTAVTELREETGLRVREDDLVAFGSLSRADLHTLTYPNGDVVHAFALCFVVRTWQGRLEPNPREVREIRWSPISDPPGPMHEPARVVLDMYRRFQQTGRFQAL